MGVFFCAKNMLLNFDAASGGTQLAGTSLTYSQTCTGSNLILFVGVGVESASDIVTGVTYNGVAMTRVPTNGFQTGNGESAYLYYLINPPTGAHNVVVSTNTSTDIRSSSASYVGSRQINQPDASNKNTLAGTPGSITTSVTTTVDNCWLVSYCQSNSGALSAGTGTTSRNASATQSIGDSNGAKSPAGAYSMQWTATHGFNMIIASITPSNATQTFNETITLSETISRSITRIYSEAVILSEIFLVSKLFFTSFYDTLLMTEQFKKLLNGVSTVWTKAARIVGNWAKVRKQ